MLLRIWGCRGSIPVATSAATIKDKVTRALRAARSLDLSDDARIDAFVEQELDWPIAHGYGGNSSCVELEPGTDSYFICDLGTGVRVLGQKILRTHGARSPRVYNVFLSHLHWDHIMGFPFFTPAYVPGNVLRIHACHPDPYAAFKRQQSDPCFPVDFDTLRGTIEFVPVSPGVPFEVDGVRVLAVRQYHGGDSYGYRFEAGGKAMVYSTDSEHKQENKHETQIFVDLFQDADAVVFDAQYSLAEMVSMKEDWGHSSNVIGVELCHMARAKRLVLFHHEPTCDDEQLHKVYQQTIRYEELMREPHHRPLEVYSAYDGMELAL